MGRIVIVDNGEDYSAHAIYFVQTDLDVAFVKKVARLTDEQATVIGVADNIAWREPGAECSIADLLMPWSAKAERVWQTLTVAEIALLIPAWEEWVKSWPGHAGALADIKHRLATPPRGSRESSGGTPPQ